ncbi:MAG: D-alanyl-D-alanine carboxypeptidase [Marinobacter sp. HL-58]|nr:MAG: D-alanyl-D-alanine carboxypeptidase [Marinobacter sp. HL-58]
MINRCRPALLLLLVPLASLAEPRCEADALPDPSADYRARVEAINTGLGISDTSIKNRGLSLQIQQDDLVVADIDPGQGVFFMSREARDAWREMQAAAMVDDVTLTLVSAFRSLEHQEQLLRDRLKNGETIETVLKTSTPPGFSEHHTGDALDFMTTDVEPFTEAFAETRAFRWLEENAADYCFKLSYPEEDNNGIKFEPWHWRLLRAGE